MKKIIALLMSLILILGLYACNSVSAPGLDETVASTETSIPATEPTAPTVEPTKNTEPTWHLQEVADKLNKYATQYGWSDKVIAVMLNWIPDMDMFKSIEQINEYQFVIYMTDDCSYRMTVNTKINEVEIIVINIESPTERDIIYVR